MGLENIHGQMLDSYSVFIHNGGQYCEGRTGLSYNRNGNSSTDSVLPLLHFEIV